MSWRHSNPDPRSGQPCGRYAHLELGGHDGAEHGVDEGDVLGGAARPELEPVPAVGEGGRAVAVLRGGRHNGREGHAEVDVLCRGQVLLHLPSQ
eukprot:1184751-Prorocentrum_minimum.AAC.9